MYRNFDCNNRFSQEDFTRQRYFKYLILAISCRSLNTSLRIVYNSQVLRGQIHEENNSTILSTPFFEVCQARKHARLIEHASIFTRKASEHTKHAIYQTYLQKSLTL